ncbi:MAG: hypothetical protein KDA81_04310 [Planctomycetaceae bacterium]|nr:hypothetical protein [Planctomycetaceae bacterium]
MTTGINIRKRRRLAISRWRVCVVGHCFGLWCVLLVAPTQVQGDPETDRAEQIFVRQLCRRQSYQLAEVYCRDALESAVADDDRAEWQLKLCRVMEEHAWFADPSERAGLLNQAAADVTDFLKTHVLSVEQQFRMRAQQAHTLCLSARMLLTIEEGGHLFGPAQVRAGQSGWPRRAELLNSSALQSVDEFVGETIFIASDLLQQLDQIRREMTPEVVRLRRTELRLILADAYVLQWRLQQKNRTPQVNLSHAAIESAEDQLKLILRGAVDEESRLRARWLEAELQLHADESSRFDLLARELLTDDLRTAFGSAEFLLVRRLLSQQKSDEAWNLLENRVVGGDEDGLIRQQLLWLKLECALGKFALARELEDERLMAATQRDFANLSQVTSQQLKGVYLAAAQRTVARFDRVREVGSELADVIEHIENLSDADDAGQAMALIDHVLNSLGASGQEDVRAALQFRAGQLMVASKEWGQAENRFQAARQLFQVTGHLDQEAAADLMRIYALGRWSLQAPTAPTDVRQHQQNYVQQLRNHLAQFSGQHTAAQAREWLLRAVRRQNPGEALEILRRMFDEESDTVRQGHLLAEMGRLIRSVNRFGLPPSGDNSRSVSSAGVETFHHAAMEWLQSRDVSDNPACSINRASVELLLLELQVSGNPAEINWLQVDRQLNQVHSTIHKASVSASEGAEREASLNDVRKHWGILDAIVAARLVPDHDRFARIESRFQQMSDSERVETIEIFNRLVGESARQPGDGTLLKWCLQLGDAVLADAQASLTSEQQETLVRVFIRAADFPSGSDRAAELLKRLVDTKRSEAASADLRRAVSLALPALTNISERPTVSLTVVEVLRDFWRRQAADHPQGSAIWLDVTLQLVRISCLSGDDLEAQKRLSLVDTLYPDWRGVERKRQAEELRKWLEAQINQ